MRVVSLIASSTEIVYALGQGKSLVGRSHECDHPAEVLRLPVLTEAMVDASASSREIDAQVKSRLRDAVSIYKVDGGRLKELAPDVILTQTQCEVCAVSLKDVEAAMGREFGVTAKVVALEPNCLADVYRDIRKVADSLGISAEGEALIGKLQKRIDAISAKAKGLRKTRVACVEWLDPLMAAGNWMPELVELAGGENLFGQAGKHSPWMTFEELRKADPDVVVMMPCGFDLERTKKEARAMLAKPEWKRLRAQTYAVDGNQFFNRPGPRLVESLEILAAILHPDEFGTEAHDGMERL
ncbi:MAG: cobalamin-binding protein [Elusimicrobia bacterium]|nr:cobalamin-binding protein [Elusimicrobiota bacterium]